MVSKYSMQFGVGPEEKSFSFTNFGHEVRLGCEKNINHKFLDYMCLSLDLRSVSVSYTKCTKKTWFVVFTFQSGRLSFEIVGSVHIYYTYSL